MRTTTAALVLLALTASGCEGEAGAGTPGSTPTPAETASPVAIESMPEGELLPPGEYALSDWGEETTTRAVVDVPEGYYPLGASTVITSAAGAPPYLALSFMTVEGVYRQGCGRPGKSKDALIDDPGPSVEDFANALAAQKLTTTSDPVPVTVDGYDGLYLELSTPADLDLSTCGDGVLDIWARQPGKGSVYAELAGQTYGIWVLDVDGLREVVAWAAFPGAPEGDLRELSAMAESTHFVDAP